MKRKKILIIYFLAMTAVMFVAVSSAVAFCDYCQPVNFSDSSGWIVTFDGVTEVTSCYPITPDGTPLDKVEPCYRFNYTISKNDVYTGVNYFSMFLADCCIEPSIYVDPEGNNLKVFDVGQGNNTDNFGQYNQLGYVVQINPDGDTSFSFLTTTNVVGSTTALLRINNKDSLSFRIAAPACTAPVPTPEGLKATEEIKNIIQTVSSSTQTDSLTQQTTPNEYQVCFKALKNIYTKCYERIYYSCFPPSGDCNDVDDSDWVEFYKLPKEPTLVTQYSGEPACENVIRVPEDAAYNLCYASSNEVKCTWADALAGNCSIAPTQLVRDGSFSNPCYPANRCVECNFGGWPYCACW